MKPRPVFRIEMKTAVRFPGGELRPGQVIRTEPIDLGTNWVKIWIPRGVGIHPVAKTLFNFEASWTVAG